MSEKLIQLLKDIKGIQEVKLAYSSKFKILCISTDSNLIIISNTIDDPKIIMKIDLKTNIKKIILHPRNENQLFIITEEPIFMVRDLKNFTNAEGLQILNIQNKDIISIKFSFFDNCFGVLYKNGPFIYFLLNEDKNLEEICNIRDLDIDYVDFNFCPLFSRGFEVFMVFFMTKDGSINMYGPFFPNEFLIPKEYIFNMENYLIYKLGTMEDRNSQENTIYCLSLNVIDDLKKSIIENKSNNKYSDFIEISDKMKVFNSSFRKREIKIHNNFLNNSGSEIFNKKYKQMHILNKRPLTILRITEKDDIDIIMIGEEIMPLELAQTGNFTFSVEESINNFFIEFIKLEPNNDEMKDNIAINQFNNEELFIKTDNSLFLIKIPYLNNLKTIAEEQMKDIPNKMKKTSITKLFKWNNKNGQNAKKSISISDILIIPEFQKLYIFGVLKEKEDKREGGFFGSRDRGNAQLSTSLKIKEKSYSEEEKKSDLSNFNNIINQKTEYDDQINEIKSKLNENEFINSTNIRRAKIFVDEKIIENEKINFESELNNQMNILYKTYKELINNNDEVFNQKINIMKNIYNNLSQSQINEAINETIKKIAQLKLAKENISKKKDIIKKKIETLKEKINKYELTDEEINGYLTILEEYQRTIGEKINAIDRKVVFFEQNINKIFSFTDLFPNLDLEFNLIKKENQDKYLEFEKIIINNSKNMNQSLSEI